MIYILLGSFVVIETTTKSIKITQQRRHFENSTAHRLASAILQEKYAYKIQKTGLPVLVAFLTSALLVILSESLFDNFMVKITGQVRNFPKLDKKMVISY